MNKTMSILQLRKDALPQFSSFCIAVAMCVTLISCNTNDATEPNSSNGEVTQEACCVGSYSDVLNKSFMPKGIYDPPAETLVMDSRVVAYNRKDLGRFTNTLGYGNGFTTDENALNAWFPHIFSDNKDPECDYFAIYFTTFSSPLTYYLTLTKDLVLNATTCNPGETGFYQTEDFIHEALLVCDDKAGTLKKSIDLSAIRIYRNSNWDCGSGIGEPNPEDVFF